MKKTLGLFLVLFVGIQKLVYAQTGIGTNSPNEQAVLEIQSVDKGVLFPSISLTSTTTFLGGISATASHTNMLVYNTNTATTTTGLDGAGYYFWNGSNWEKITGDTDGQSLAEVTAIGSSTFDVIQVGGIFDSGDLTVNGESSLQGDVRLGVFGGGQTLTVNALVDTNILFFGPGRDIASTATPVTNIFGDYIKPGSGNDLDLDTNDSSNRITFSNNTNIKAGVNSSTLFVGDDAGPDHYKFPSGTASRSPGQVLSLDTTTEQLNFTTLLTLPTATNDGATLRWDTTGNEWQESTDLRIAPNSSSEVWINQNLLPSSTLLDIGQPGNNFDEVYADQFLSSQTGSITFGTSNDSNKIYLKFEGDSPGNLVLNERNAIAGQNNTAFGYQTFNTAGTTGNNNVAIGHSVLSSSTGTGGNNVGIGTSALQNNLANDNVAIGNEALLANSQGTQNVAVGSNALDENTTGQYNTAVGYNALHANTTGENNIAIGKAAMADNITGQKNIVIGTDADVGVSDLENAIAIGFSTTVNASNTIRLGNTDIESIISSGTLTLDGVTYPNATGTAGQVLTVSSTTENLYFSTIPTLPASFDDGATLRWNLSATEWEATTDFRIAPGTGYSLPNAIWIEKSIIPSSTINLGQSGNEFEQTFTEELATSSDVLIFTTKLRSVYLKKDSTNLELTTNGSAIPASSKNNVAFGFDVMNSTSTSAEGNAVFGQNSLQSITTGDDNLAFGIAPLQDLTSGQYNVGIGKSALSELTTASATTAIGYGSGENARGSRNTAVGYLSMRGTPLSSGTDNTALGIKSVFDLTSGEKNVGVGNYALENITTGEKNVAIGVEALQGLLTGTKNIAVGYKALSDVLNSGNIALGDSAATNTDIGSNNIVIGNEAMDTNTDGSNNIIIGNLADVGLTNLNNAIAIGYNSTVNSSNTIRLGNTDVKSVISSGTLTLDQVTYPNTIGTAGQVLTVSSTLGKLYFADAAGSSTTPTLDQVTTTGSQTNNSIQVGALTVSSTTGLSIKNGSDRYFLPTTQGTAGQSLIVSTTTSQLVFSSPFYLLASHSGGYSLVDETDIGNFSVESNNGITMTGDSTFNLPAGKIYELVGYVRLSGGKGTKDIAVRFHNGSSYEGVSGAFMSMNYNSDASSGAPARAFIDATTSSKTITLRVNYVSSNGQQSAATGTYVSIKEL
jgi:hypothetical protein